MSRNAPVFRTDVFLIVFERQWNAMTLMKKIFQALIQKKNFIINTLIFNLGLLRFAIKKKVEYHRHLTQIYSSVSCCLCYTWQPFKNSLQPAKHRPKNIYMYKSARLFVKTILPSCVDRAKDEN